ncbi:MAG TPA: TolC family outer membrane protein, partial [Steroidobacteraceae bacterium]
PGPRMSLGTVIATAVAVSLASTCPELASGKDLIGVYQDALRYDTQIREAEATMQATKEADPQAWAALLPQLNGNYAISRQKQEQSLPEGYPRPGGGQPLVFPFTSTAYNKNYGYQLQLTQSLFSWANIQTLAQAHKKVAQADATYRAAQQDLINRVATAYFNVLNAVDNLAAQQASLEALTSQLDQANKRYQVGLIAITDVKESQAAHDAQAAAVIDAKRNLANMLQALRQITAQDYPDLSKPGDNMPLLTPKPADPGSWVSTSMDQNLTLVSARLAADVARDQVQIAFGGHLPSLEITGTRSDQRSSIDETQQFAPNPPIRFPGSGKSVNSQIGIQVTVPLFSGGLVQSQVRQAQFEWISAKDHVDTVSRQTEASARDAYDGVVSEVARVEALKQGVVSADTALRATEAGAQVGTRTTVEVLQQRQNLVSAQTNYAQARYTYLLDMIALRLAAGTLDESTLKEINGWLTVNQSTSTSLGSQPAPTVPPQP